MMSLVINLDSDGVVFPFHDKFVHFASHRGIETDPTTWNLGLEPDVFRGLFFQAVHHGLFFAGEPIEGSVDGIHTLLDAGHRVRIVTSKVLGDKTLSSIAMRDTIEWYENHVARDLEFVFTGSVHGKTYYPADVTIDDHPSGEWRQRGLNILFDQPWNADELPCVLDCQTYYRAVGWDEVLAIIELHEDRGPIVV